MRGLPFFGGQRRGQVPEVGGAEVLLPLGGPGGVVALSGEDAGRVRGAGTLAIAASCFE